MLAIMTLALLATAGYVYRNQLTAFAIQAYAKYIDPNVLK